MGKEITSSNGGQPRIGVYICHCGSNIAGVVDVEDVAKWAKDELGEDGVVIAKEYKFMCSSLGQDMIETDIKENGLTRVVVAACSPHLHEKTFRNAAERAGLNPYYCEMASIREQVSWVHKDKKLATEKSESNGCWRRGNVLFSTKPWNRSVSPLPRRPWWVGGGIAGIQAALEIANTGFKVYLVEREPSIGGHMAQFDKTFPTLDCSACILTPRMSEAGTHPNIELPPGVR